MAAEVVGRGLELEAIRDFLARLSQGPAALLLEGEAGIGKTTVWLNGAAAAEAEGFAVMRARPTEAEAALPFAALIDLLEGVLDEGLAELPAPQARALETALLRAEPSETPVEQLAVSMAVLGVLRGLASSGPLLVAIDDVPWLDASSAHVLAFVCRRLDDEPIGLLATRRIEQQSADPLELARAFPDGRFEELIVGPLSSNALDLLLRDRLDLVLSPPELETVLERSAGNPLYALELGRALQAGARLEAGQALPVAASLGALVEERVGALSDAGRSVLLEAAALSRPNVAGFDDRWEALEEALASGLLDRDGARLRFAHPLYGSAVYGGASPQARRAAHARLAERLEDPEERALHLAVATEDCDEDVAQALEDAAGRAAARGAPEVAGVLAEHARRLTAANDPDKAYERTLAAADYDAHAGDLRRSRSLVTDLIATLPPGHGRAAALLRLARDAPTLDDMIARSEQAIVEADGDDLLLARGHLILGQSLGFNEPSFTVWAEHIQCAVEHAERAPPDTVLVEALSALALVRFGRGYGVQREVADRAIELEKSLGAPSTVYEKASTQLGLQLFWAGEHEEAREIFGRELAGAVQQGDVWSQAALQSHLADLERRAGNWVEADTYAARALELDRQINETSESAWFARAVVDAHLGRVETARSAVSAGLEDARHSNNLVWANHNRCVLGFLELSLGNVQAAAGILRELVAELRVIGVGEPALHPCAPDAVEALVATGELDEAEAIARELLETGERLDRIWALATASRGLALVASARGDGAAAGEWIERALREHERMSQPFELARTLLVKGTILRRQKRKGQAKVALDEALAIFERLPAPLWAAKCREEVRRLGLRPSRDGGLTDTEQKVAELVAAGGTNKEVAAELFLSVKTVEANLSRIYRKLGVRSRTELARAMHEAAS
jgi:DNA-binding CsgD family transcriptional regulator